MSPRPLLAAVAVALTATGCVRATTTVVVEGDGSGTVDVVLAVDPSALSATDSDDLPPALSGLGADDAQLCQQLQAQASEGELPEGAEVTMYDEDGFCGSRIHFDFDSTEELSQSLQATIGDDTTTASQFVLREESDGWRFQAPFTSLPEQGAVDIPPAMIGAVLRDAEVTYEVTLPGEASQEHNATSVDGGTFHWDIDLADPPDLLFARTSSSASPAGGLLVPLVAGLGALAVLAVAGLLLVRRRAAGDILAGAGGGYFEPGTGDSWGPVPSPAPLDTGERLTPWPTDATPDTPMTAEPRWDPHLGAWVADHPSEGLLIHDDDAGQWRRA